MATDPMWCFEYYGEAAEHIDELEAENARLREELAQAHATIERSVDDGIDKIMGMSDDQIKALCAFDGHHPDDEARIGRLCGEVAIVKAQLAAAQLDAARDRCLIQNFGNDDAENPINKMLDAHDSNNLPSKEVFDAAIDSAIAQANCASTKGERA